MTTAGRGVTVAGRGVTVAERIPVAVLGATGLVGQHFVARLANHPWFEVRELRGSPRSSGQEYRCAVTWSLESELPARVAGIRLREPGAPLASPIVFSALPSNVAAEWEPVYAKRGHFIATNASALRLRMGVPIIVPELNAETSRLVTQQSWHSTGGVVIANPNCVVAGLSLVLAPLHRAFGIEAVTVVTLQAASGAGRSGLGALAALDNVIPHIDGESEKIQRETLAILDADFPIAVAVNRVPVRDGHMGHVFVRFASRVTAAEAAEALREFRGPDPVSCLPTAPNAPIVVCDDPYRPQPILDVARGDGMTVTVGCIGHDPVHGVRFSFLVHNLVRGAAGGSILNAELAVRLGLVRNNGCG